MDRKNILSEGFFDKLKDYWKFLKTQGRNLTSDEKKLLANPKLRSKYKAWTKAQDNLQKTLDKVTKDLEKTKLLKKAGWTVVRVREKPLKILSRKYNVLSNKGQYKETGNKVLNKLNQLGYEVKGLDKYLERKTLVNKKEAEKYMEELLRKRSSVS